LERVMLPQPPWMIMRGLVGGVFFEEKDMVCFGVCDFGFGMSCGGKCCDPEVWDWFL
jgi:hypothetical protein